MKLQSQWAINVFSRNNNGKYQTKRSIQILGRETQAELTQLCLPQVIIYSSCERYSIRRRLSRK
jgi:hypothetical protein